MKILGCALAVCLVFVAIAFLYAVFNGEITHP